MSAPSPKDSLSNWLSWLEHLHPTEIEMGLDRVGKVADRLGLRPAPMPLILVGGTNGKGSTVALLASIYTNAGYRVGSYTSPHIDVFNERMSVNNSMLSDAFIVDALHQVESGREDVTLTYFEYTTLAAMLAFQEMRCDIAVMEVGLGGRLDATNLWDCDCAILTSIALDHQEYLGDTVELVAAEKVAIGRAGTPMIVGEKNPPANLESLALAGKMKLQFIDDNNLPRSALNGAHQRRNAACALAAVDAMQTKLPVSAEDLEAGLSTVYLPGRFEQVEIHGQAAVLDVAHNPAAAASVREALQATFPKHHIYAVFAALNDKDVVGIASELAPAIASWYCAGLEGPRATKVASLVAQLEESQSSPVKGFDTVADAWNAARADASASASDVVILVAGSFYTITELSNIAAFQSETTA